MPPSRPDARPNRYRSVSDYRDIASTYDASCRLIGNIRHAGVNAMELQRGQTVLDIACGTGAKLLELASRVGPHGKVIGIDHSPEMAIVAQHGARVATVGAKLIGRWWAAPLDNWIRWRGQRYRTTNRDLARPLGTTSGFLCGSSGI